jgi:hypothetical protein
MRSELIVDEMGDKQITNEVSLFTPSHQLSRASSICSPSSKCEKVRKKIKREIGHILVSFYEQIIKSKGTKMKVLRVAAHFSVTRDICF